MYDRLYFHINSILSIDVKIVTYKRIINIRLFEIGEKGTCNVGPVGTFFVDMFSSDLLSLP